MKTHLKTYDPYEEFRNSPEKVESLIKLYPKSERPLAEKAADLLLSMKFSHAEHEAEKTKKLAQIADQLQTKFSKTHKKEDPLALIDVGLTGNEGFDPFHYIASYHCISLILPNALILDKNIGSRGMINFTFPNGLPVGYYAIWVNWIPFTGQKECKIECNATAYPISAVNPNTVIEKYTEPTVPGQLLFSGMDMTWEIVSPNTGATFCIKNDSGEYVACLGVTMVASF